MKPSPRLLIGLLIAAGCLSAGWMRLWTAFVNKFEIDLHIDPFLYFSVALFGMLSAWIIWKYGFIPLPSKRIGNMLVAVAVPWVFGFFFPGIIGILIFLSNLFPGFSKKDGDALLWLAALIWLAWFGMRQYWQNLEKLGYVSDTPTSNIRSAAQGYVELKGTLTQAEGRPALIAPLSHNTCLWWDYEIEKLEYRNTYIVETGCSDDWLHLVDETGQCRINPLGAAVKPHQDEDWKVKITRPQLQTAIPLTPRGKPLAAGTYRYSERLLLPEHKLYALGDFRSRGGQHQLAKPDDGRPFVLSGENEDEVKGQARFDAALGAILCLVGTLGALGVLWSMWR